MELLDRLIISLDFADSEHALSLVDLLGDNASFYKVGLQMYLHYGFHFVEQLKKRGKKVFLDLKLNDIPNTICSAIQVLGSMNVDMVNVHCCIGYEGMKLAKETMQIAMPTTKLIGVTVLTSLNDEALKEIGFNHNAKEEVLILCRLGKMANIDGVVSSAQEVKSIKSECGKSFLTICPGIRRATDDINDQSRIVTPEIAIRDGADYLVVGRPIIKAISPKDEVLAYLSEIEKGLD